MILSMELIGSNIRPGFIKISVDGASSGISELHKKLARAAGLTHLKTGLTIYSHTGPGVAAFEQIEMLKELKNSSICICVGACAGRER